MVRSSSVVLPDPGELIRLTATTPRSASQRRLSAASSSLRASTRCSRSTRVGAQLVVPVPVAVAVVVVVVVPVVVVVVVVIVVVVVRDHAVDPHLVCRTRRSHTWSAPPPPIRSRARGRRRTSTSALPHSHSRIRSSSAMLASPQLRQCSRPSGSLDLERGAFERGPGAGQLEAELQGVAHHPGQPAHPQPHQRHALVAGAREHRVDHALGD